MEKLEGIRLTGLTQKLLKAYCDETGDDPRAVLITALQGLLDRQKRNKELAEQYETVTVQVHKQLMRLIQEANYFGRTREKFFADCITAGTDVSVNDSDYDEAQRLQKKYKTEKLHLLEVYPDKTTLRNIETISPKRFEA